MDSPLGRPLTKHEASLFLKDLEPLERKKDNGFRFGVTEEEMEGRDPRLASALSTWTASIPELRSFRKQELLRVWAPDKHDTGATRVQVAMLSDRVTWLQNHIRKHNHDKHALRTIAIVANRRRKLLRYMMRNDYDNYRVCIRELEMRPTPMFYSKYPPRRPRQTHQAIAEKRKRLKNRKSRGYKGH